MHLPNPEERSRNPLRKRLLADKTIHKGKTKKSHPAGTHLGKQAGLEIRKIRQKRPLKKVHEEEEYVILPKIDNSRIYYHHGNPNMKKPSVVNPGKIKSRAIEVEKILVCEENGIR